MDVAAAIVAPMILDTIPHIIHPLLQISSLACLLPLIFSLNGGISGYLNLLGVVFVLGSALVYAIYIVLVKNLQTIKHMKHDKLSFYVMLMGLTVFIFNLKFCTELQPISDWRVFACSIALAIIPTIISLETFNETLIISSIIGIFLILSGVLLIILKK